MLGGQGHLAHQVRGEEHGAALCGELLQQVADPLDPLGVEAVGRLVEDQDLWVGEQRRGDAEPLAHAERELPDTFPGDLLETDAVDHLVDPPPGNPVGLCQGEQVVVRRAAGVDGARLEQRADLVERRRVLAVALPVHGHRSRGRAVEPEDQPHRRRLPRPVRPEEPGDGPREHGEREAVDGPLLPVVLGQAFCLDHAPRRYPPDSESPVKRVSGGRRPRATRPSARGRRWRIPTGGLPPSGRTRAAPPRGPSRTAGRCRRSAQAPRPRCR